MCRTVRARGDGYVRPKAQLTTKVDRAKLGATLHFQYQTVYEVGLTLLKANFEPKGRVKAASSGKE
jgi:hypothetical protein